MSSTLRLAVVALAALTAGACAKVHGRAEPERPPLEVPAVPPRAIAPALPAVELPPDLTGAEAPVSQPGPRPAVRAPRGEASPARPEAARGDEAAEPRADEASEPRSGAEPRLRTLTAADDEEASRRVREMLDRASKNLGTVDYGALRAEGRAQYDTAKRFMEQASEALKAQNLVFALFLADKADTIARQLQGR